MDQELFKRALRFETLQVHAGQVPAPATGARAVPESAGDRVATHKRYAERRSILDDVASEAASLDRKLGTNDRRKLDEYLSSVRQTEKQVERMQSWIDKPKAEVQNTGLQLGSKSGDGHDRPMWLDVMLELTDLAFITDTTRVITFEFAR